VEEDMTGKRVHAGLWWRNLKERDHVEDQSVDESL
jgi:hypothetical protein